MMIYKKINKILRLIFLINIAIIISFSCQENNFIDSIDEQDIDSSSFIKLNNYYCFFDTINEIALVTINSNEIDNYSAVITHSKEYEIAINNKIINNGEHYDFGTSFIDDEYYISVTKNNLDIEYYSLFFTTLPTASIITTGEIIDDPKILSKIYINDSKQNFSHQSWTGIELRGATAQTFPKKSYDLELWEDEEGINSSKINLFELRSDDDWHLDAMFVDLSRTRNILSMNTWSSFARAEHLLKTEDAILAQRGQLLELFINQEYHGIYSFNEQIDRKQLGLKKNGGILYKTEYWSPEVRFLSIESEPDNSIIWNGYEIEYANDLNTNNWYPIYDLVSLVAYSDDSTFYNSVEALIDIDNSIDIWIFLNAILANDNIGKNMYIFKYDEHSKLSFAPWDLDLTFGNKNSPYSVDDPDDAILTNNLYDRLFELNVNNYKNKVKIRWNELYSNGLFESIIFDLQSKINQITQSEAGNRENFRWGIETNYNQKFDYINSWLETRFVFFDSYINETF